MLVKKEYSVINGTVYKKDLVIENDPICKKCRNKVKPLGLCSIVCSMNNRNQYQEYSLTPAKWYVK